MLRKLFDTFSIVFVTILITFLVLEIFSRYYLFNHTNKADFRRYASLQQLEKSNHSHDFKFSLHRYLGYIPAPNYQDGKNKHNRLGFRGDEFPVQKPENEYRIITLGGSTTYTSFVEDYQLSYPAQMEQALHQKGHLHVRVINAGVGGWRSHESLINLQLRLLELEPDLIVIYHSVNDLMARFVWPPEKYRGDNSGQLQPRFSRIFMPSLLEYNTLLRTLLLKAEIVNPHATVDQLVSKFNKKTFYGKKFTQQKNQSTYPLGLFKEISAKKMLAENTPNYFQNNMKSMVSISQTNNIHVMLATFANSTQFKQPKSSSPEFIQGYQEHNTLIQSLGDSYDVPVLDFAKQFPQDKQYYLDGRHVNEAGAKLKGKLFADFVAKNFL